MKRILTVLFFVLLFAGTGFTADKTVIAVLEFDARGARGLDTGMLTLALEAALYHRGYFTVVDRTRVKEILEEHALGLSGVLSDSDQIHLGQFAGARLIVSGTIGYSGDRYSLYIKAIDTETGVIRFTDNVSAWDEPGLESVMNALAKRIERLAQGRRVGEYRIPRRPEPAAADETDEWRGNNWAFRVPRFVLRGTSIEINPIAGNILHFTNSSIYGLGASFKFPDFGIVQLDAGISYYFGYLTTYAKINCFRFNPAVVVNVLENRYLALGARAGYAFEICNVRKADAGVFSAGIYPFNQNSLTASLEICFKLSEKFHIRSSWEIGFPLKFSPDPDMDPVDLTTSAQCGIDQLEASQGMVTSIWSLKFDILN